MNPSTISKWEHLGKHLWETWDLRLAILFSLLLQILLIFLAPLRKRMSQSYVLVPLWFAYLLADATAVFAAGLIIRGQGDTYGPFANPDLVAFWTPFLLVHLGGPDTITAFALEDDELWLRHLLGLGFPCWAVVYASVQSFPKTELRLRIATVLIFIVGVTKYIERTRALYLASSRTLKESMLVPPSPGFDYAKFMDEHPDFAEFMDEHPDFAEFMDKHREYIEIRDKYPGYAEFLDEYPEYAEFYIKFMDKHRCYADYAEFMDKHPESHIDTAAYAEFMDTHPAYAEFMDTHPAYAQLMAKHLAFAMFRDMPPTSAEFKAKFLETHRQYSEFMGQHPDYDNFMKMYRDAYANWMPEYDSALPERTSAKLSDLKEVQCAYYFLEYIKILVADLVMEFPERNKSRDFFFEKTPRQAFRILEVELNFLYDILYTKASVVQGMLGYLVRILLFILTFSSLALFYFMEKKEFSRLDIVITYTLLLGAISLDLISFVMVLSSDWTVVALAKSNNRTWGIKFLRKLLRIDRETRPSARKITGCFFLGKITQIARLRWSKCISQYNLLDYCLHPCSKWWEKTTSFFGLTSMLNGMRYVETAEFTDDMRDFIFKELKRKSILAADPKTTNKMCSTIGEEILLQREDQRGLLRRIKDVEFDESLLLWHIATELCFNTDGSNNNSGAAGTSRNSVDESTYSDDEWTCRDMSKRLSDYMLYLLVANPSLLSTLAGNGQTRFKDTCADAKRFFRRRKINEPKDFCLDIFSFCKRCFWKKCCCKGENGPDKLLKIKGCKSILAVNTAIKPASTAIEKRGSKSVLFDACILAKELKKIDGGDRWRIISQVWVELLSHAAFSCKARTHAAQLSKGGQLITLVWLLMAHLGLAKFVLDGAARRYVSDDVLMYGGGVRTFMCEQID